MVRCSFSSRSRIFDAFSAAAKGSPGFGFFRRSEKSAVFVPIEEAKPPTAAIAPTMGASAPSCTSSNVSFPDGVISGQAYTNAYGEVCTKSVEYRSWNQVDLQSKMTRMYLPCFDQDARSESTKMHTGLLIPPYRKTLRTKVTSHIVHTEILLKCL